MNPLIPFTMSARQNFKPLFARQFPRGGFRMLPRTYSPRFSTEEEIPSGYVPLPNGTRLRSGFTWNEKPSKLLNNSRYNSRHPVLVPSKASIFDRICIWPSMYDLNWNLIVPKKMNRDDYCLKRRMKLFLIVKNILGIFHDYIIY